MSLFRGGVSQNGDAMSVQLAGRTLPVGASSIRRYGALRAKSGQSVVVGVRAEDVHPAAARPDLPTLDATVELIEALGSGVMAYFHVEADEIRPPGTHGGGPEEIEEGIARPNLIAAFPPRIELEIGERVPVAVDADALHFFDEETGEALR
jgi:multiple sugar transport system ATP-binding protein